MNNLTDLIYSKKIISCEDGKTKKDILYYLCCYARFKIVHIKSLVKNTFCRLLDVRGQRVSPINYSGTDLHALDSNKITYLIPGHVKDTFSPPFKKKT
jgi:hypothetical protein